MKSTNCAGIAYTDLRSRTTVYVTTGTHRAPRWLNSIRSCDCSYHAPVDSPGFRVSRNNASTTARRAHVGGDSLGPSVGHRLAQLQKCGFNLPVVRPLLMTIAPSGASSQLWQILSQRSSRSPGRAFQSIPNPVLSPADVRPPATERAASAQRPAPIGERTASELLTAMILRTT